MAGYQSKFRGAEVDAYLDYVKKLQEEGLDLSAYATKEELKGKQDKIPGKGLSTEDFTTTLKNKLNSLNNYDDAEIKAAIESLRSDFDLLVSGDTTRAIKSYNDIISFLEGIEDSESLDNIIAGIQQQIANVRDAIPTMTSQLTNDSGFLTEHQDISGKQDKIDDLDAIRSGAEKGATALQKHQDISHLATKENIKALSDAGKVQQTQIAENKSRIDATAINVNKLSEEVDKLNGDGEGSVKDIAAQEVAKVIDSAPETMDTLKKIADLIEKDAEQAADILATLGDHETRIDTLENRIVVLSETEYENLTRKEDKFYFCYEE
jgi:hypothetical protein